MTHIAVCSIAIVCTFQALHRYFLLLNFVLVSNEIVVGTTGTCQQIPFVDIADIFVTLAVDQQPHGAIIKISCNISNSL